MYKVEFNYWERSSARVGLALLLSCILALGMGCGNEPADAQGAGGSSGGGGGDGGESGGGTGGDGGSGGSGGSTACSYDSLIIENQADAQSKLSMGCNQVDGDLVIRFSDLQNLDLLATIQAVEGDVLLEHNSELESLDGLSQLETVGGVLSIFSNPSVAPSLPFPKLKTVERDLIVRANGGVSELGFGALERVGGGFVFQKNRLLLTCKIHDLFDRLEVGGQFIISENLDKCP